MPQTFTPQPNPSLRRVLAIALLGVLAAEIRPALGQAEGPSVFGVGINSSGLPGLLEVPAAVSLPTGSVDLRYSPRRRAGAWQHNVTVGIGFLPRLTLVARGVLTDDIQDLSANAHLLVVEEAPWTPALAVGIADVTGGALHFRSIYLVASKTLVERLRLTAGVGSGPQTPDGIFGGVELALAPFLEVVGEHDGVDLNLGLRIAPLPRSLEADGWPRLGLDVSTTGFSGVTLSASVQGNLEPRRSSGRGARAPGDEWPTPRARGASASPSEMSAALQAALVAQGFENVRVRVLRRSGRPRSGLTVEVEYENRRYNRDELDALGIVALLAATRTPSAAESLRIITLKASIAVAGLQTSADAFLAFVNGELPEDAFGDRLRVWSGAADPDPSDAIVLAATDVGNTSALRVDAFIGPGIDTLLLTEVGAFDARFTLIPQLVMQLPVPGLVLDARMTVPVVQSSGYQRFGGELPAPALDRLLASQALSVLDTVHAPRWIDAGLLQLSLGLFGRERSGAPKLGASVEAEVSLLEGLFAARGFLAWTASDLDQLDRWGALGEGRARYAPWDLTLRVTGGLFADGDRGGAVELRRFFGDTEIGFFLRHTTHGSQAGVQIALPLTPGEELAPFAIRPRLPELFTYEQHTTVFTPVNFVKNDIGRALVTGHEIARAYWNRDRLHPWHVRQHLDTLRRAAEWVE